MITQILAAVLLLGICIFFHELGHFLIGKWVGIRPRIFSIGYGRGVWFKKKGKTIFQITAIPIGGYVQFYGDDITKEHANLKKGDFFAAGPWRRIALAFGGPLFSMLLGFVVLFILVAVGWQPISNKVKVDAMHKSAAAQAGLRDGDRIVAVNGDPTQSFEKVSYAIAFAASSEFVLDVERGGRVQQLKVTIPPREEGGIRQFEGLRPAGNPYLAVTADKKFSNGSELLKDDKIIAANDTPVGTVSDLIAILNKGEKSEIKLSVLRRAGSVIAPEAESTLTIVAPLQQTQNITLTNIKDLQTGKSIPTREILASQSEIFTHIQVNGVAPLDWASLTQSLAKAPKQADGSVALQIGAVEMQAQFATGSRRMLGIVLSEGVDAERANLPRTPVALVTRTFDEMTSVTKGTLLGLYRIIQGKLSFNKSVSGPVKIMAVAAKSVSAGWETYWFLLAQITIVLGIMNLLPIPVLDGGHILFYLIEAFYKPLPPPVIASVVRVAMLLLITVGIYVIGLDIWDVFVRGWM